MKRSRHASKWTYCTDCVVLTLRDRALTSAGLTAEETSWVDTECDGNLVDHVDRRAVHAPLESADIGAIYACLVRERLLRKPALMANLSQVAGEDLSYIHEREAIPLMDISPRGMLDNRMEIALVLGISSLGHLAVESDTTE